MRQIPQGRNPATLDLPGHAGLEPQGYRIARLRGDLGQAFKPDQALELAIDQPLAPALGLLNARLSFAELVLQQLEKFGLGIKALFEACRVFLESRNPGWQLHLARIAPEQGGQARIAFAARHGLQARADLEQLGFDQAQIEPWLDIPVSEVP